ncbi:MAG: hypothetical protein LBN08_05955 [Lactobacillales bacterium]|jgi:DNA repair exonuclease SbcCD nuclease subunit|nr:hypothetical protein [Lactobacillales bacterium]
MKFIHTTKLQLDSAYRAIECHDDIERLVKSNIDTLNNLVDAAIEHDVDVVLLVSETFHKKCVSYATSTAFNEAIDRLSEHNIKILINFHGFSYFNYIDERIKRSENLFIFNDKNVETFEFITKNAELVKFSGFSYLNDDEPFRVGNYPVKGNEDYHIGLMYKKSPEEAVNLPVALDHVMKSFEYDYWAMGGYSYRHLYMEEPFAFCPGTPNPHNERHMFENSVQFVELKGGKLDTYPIAINVVGYHRLELDVRTAESFASIMNLVVSEMNELYAGLSPQEQIAILNIDLKVDKKLLSSQMHEHTFNYLKNEIERLGFSKFCLNHIEIIGGHKDELIRLPLGEDEFKEYYDNKVRTTDVRKLTSDIYDDKKIKEIIKAKMDAKSFAREVMKKVGQEIEGNFTFEERG